MPDLYFERLGEQFDAYMSEYDVVRRGELVLDLCRRVVGCTPGFGSFGKALEVGCGTGRISEKVAPLAREFTVVDISEKLARACGTRIGCHYAAQDACSLAFASGSFDLVVSSECIEHTRDPWEAMAEMARVCGPSGILIVTTPNKLWYPVLWAAQGLGIRKFRGPERWIWPSALKQWLKKTGWTSLEFSGCHLIPWQVPMAQKWLPRVDRLGHVLYRGMINFGFAARKAKARA